MSSPPRIPGADRPHDQAITVEFSPGRIGSLDDTVVDFDVPSGLRAQLARELQLAAGAVKPGAGSSQDSSPPKAAPSVADHADEWPRMDATSRTPGLQPSSVVPIVAARKRACEGAPTVTVGTGIAPIPTGTAPGLHASSISPVLMAPDAVRANVRAASPPESPAELSAHSPVPASPAPRGRAPTAVAAPPGSSLFRQAALDAYQRGDEVTRPLLLDGLSVWTVLAFCAALIGGVLGIAAFGHVEVTSFGRAVLRAEEGVRPLAALTGGVISNIAVEVGQRVRRGEVLAAIDASELNAQQLEAARELEAIRLRHADEEREGARLFEEAIALLERRASLASRRIRAQRAELSRLRSKELELADLSARGLVPKTEGEQVKATLAQSEQGRLSLVDTLTETLAQATALRRDRAERTATREQELRASEARLASVQLRMSQTELRAPADGIVETVLASVGDRVDPGVVVLRVGPKDPPTQVVAFVPERDRAFLKEGAMARLEVDRLPVGEFGTLPARVVRVGREVAPAQEVVRVLGGSEPKEPLVRVDLDLVDSPQRARLGTYLRSGTLMSARVPLRERRVIGLLFEPIRRWLES